MKDMNDVVFWRDVPVRIYHKIKHIHKLKGKIHKNFTQDFGDIPMFRYNPKSGKYEKVVNFRGYAYAKRRDIKYRKRSKYKMPKYECEG